MPAKRKSRSSRISDNDGTSTDFADTNLTLNRFLGPTVRRPYNWLTGTAAPFPALGHHPPPLPSAQLTGSEDVNPSSVVPTQRPGGINLSSNVGVARPVISVPESSSHRQPDPPPVQSLSPAAYLHTLPKGTRPQQGQVENPAPNPLPSPALSNGVILPTEQNGLSSVRLESLPADRSAASASVDNRTNNTTVVVGDQSRAAVEPTDIHLFEFPDRQRNPVHNSPTVRRDPPRAVGPRSSSNNAEIETPTQREQLAGQPRIVSSVPNWDPNAVQERLRKIERAVGIQNIGPSDGLRVRFLSEAINRYDWWYLLLHQIVSMDVIRADLPYRILQIPNLRPALSIVKGWLLFSDSGFNLQLLRQLADFPCPLSTLLVQSPGVFIDKLDLISQFISKLPLELHKLVDSCRERSFPPLVHELVENLCIHSVVLQYVVFQVVAHHIWNIPPDANTESLSNVFLKNQLEHFKRRQRDDPALSAPEAAHEYFKHASVYNALRMRYHIAPSLASHQVTQPPTVHSSNGSVLWNHPLHGVSERLGATDDTLHRLSNSNSATRGPSCPRNSTANSNTNTAPQLTHPPMSEPSLRNPLQNSPVNAVLENPSLTRNQAPQRPQNTIARVGGQINPRRDIPFYPTAGQMVARRAVANPRVTAAQEAHLRSPRLGPVDNESARTPSNQFRVVSGFAMDPQAYPADKILHDFTFDLSPEDFAKIPKDIPGASGKRPLRQLRSDSKTFRLRCIELPQNAEAITFDERMWITADTTWPSNCYMLINDVDIFPRRKFHWGKDLPIDLTPHLKQGQNKLKACFNIYPTPTAASPTAIRWAFGVEAVTITTFNEICTSVVVHRRISSENTKSKLVAAVSRHLSPKDTEDDDFMVTTSSLRISLRDPISQSRICKLPIRGRYCRHPNAFDLPAFLQIATRDHPNWPACVDIWRCPICKSDVRPKNMGLDEFLSDVRVELESRGKEVAESAEAIVIKEDGSWEVASRTQNTQVDNERRKSKGKGILLGSVEPKRGYSARPSSSSSKRAMVSECIILSDDDDE
ncbi:hypothetical protein P152DRAFT_472688 [Eremomyces bilateralis CBS 781.70]|uniref:SP-RING-type domain-containing protein n=1 Tax=Eremomyces bilateralis CBS 781.70 TaxID=1392243 RepID=A0A6G1G789_9PEZI|nr:uncharacterized protein P152DRAFT_472688 [Eremomyces bilateralis CBS 781.70]KAF1813894.1 hypothetical protein P152DRAFT_472688 [Eremomyces bilateralis CBS 781.70]